MTRRPRHPLLPLGSSLLGSVLLGSLLCCLGCGGGSEPPPDVSTLHAVGILATADAGLEEPMALAVGPRGRIYVADAAAGTVFLFAPQGDRLGTLGDEVLEVPMGVAVTPAGDVFVSDFALDRIARFDAAGELVTQWGTTGNGPGEFSAPAGLAVGPGGNVYVIDYNNHRVQVFHADGTFVASFGKEGPFATSPEGSFHNPGGVTVDAKSFVYVADTHNFRMQKFTADGAFVLSWGKQGTWKGEFDHPYGPAVDAWGRVYVTDNKVKLEGGDRIEIFSARGEYLGELGRSGTQLGEFRHPVDVAIGADNLIYVAETGNRRVQILAFGP